MAEQIGEIYYTVRADTAQLVQGEQVASRSLDRLESGMGRTDKAASQLNTGLSGLAKAISAVIAASALRDMARMVQSYQEMAERVQMATSSQAEFEMVQKRLLATANGTYRSLAEAQELYIRTADSLRSMGYSTAQALDVTDSMAYAFVRNATSAERAESAISAVSKAFNTGKVAADQWETITTALPSVINDVAAASGKSAAQVRALGAAGKLTAADLSEGLRRALDENATAAQGMANNLTDAGVRSRNALTVLLVALEDQSGALDTFTNAIISAADMLTEFAGDAGNVETVLTTLQLAITSTAAVIAGRMVMALAASATAFYSSTVAATAKARADLAAAQAATVHAAQELILARAAAQATVGLSTHTVASQRLAAAELAAAAATNTLSAAQQRMAGIAGIASTAVGGLRAAMSFLGGPVGVALLAAGALYTFATRAEEAKAPVDLLTGSVNDLGDAALRLQRIQITDKLDQLKGLGATAATSGASVEYLKSQLAQFPNSAKADEWRRRLAEQEAAAESAGAELAQYQQRLDEIDAEAGRRSGGGTAAPSGAPALAAPVDEKAAKAADTAAKAIRDQVEALQLQADTLGMSATEVELYNLQLAGASDAQIRAAATSLALVDAFKQQADAEKLAGGAAAEAERKRKAQQQLLGQVDPIAGEQNRFQTEIENLRLLNEAKLIEDQRYLDLKLQAEQAHDEQMRALQEENFRRQSVANELLMASLDQLQQGATNALVGLVTGASNGQEAIQALAGAILREGVGALVQMGIQQVKNLIMGQAAAATATAAGVAQAGVLSAAYAPAAALASLASFGANAVPAQAAIVSTVGMSKAAALAGGRRYGGPVDAGGMHRINENGNPEIMQAANGNQYLLPNTRGEVISNEDATSGGSGAANVVINITNNTGAQVTQKETQTEDSRVIDIVVGDMIAGGKTAQTIQGVFGVRRQGK